MFQFFIFTQFLFRFFLFIFFSIGVLCICCESNWCFLRNIYIHFILIVISINVGWFLFSRFRGRIDYIWCIWYIKLHIIITITFLFTVIIGIDIVLMFVWLNFILGLSIIIILLLLFIIFIFSWVCLCFFDRFFGWLFSWCFW